MIKITDLSDEELVSSALSGNMNAYNQLLARYSDKIQQILLFQLADKASVKDLTQEVFLKVYRYLHHFKKNSLFSTWLHRIIQNTLKNHYRTINLRQSSEIKYLDTQYQSTNLSPESLLSTIEFTEQIETELSKLSKELSCCYGLYLLGNNTYEDIAKKMHCPVGTVRSRIFRARKILLGSLKL